MYIHYIVVSLCVCVCRVEHGNIVKLIELFDSKGKLYLVMEL